VALQYEIIGGKDMKRKNFSAQPNNFLHDENKEHQLTQLLKNPTEKLIVIVIDGLQKKFGKNFQKSAKQLAAMCLCARSTFINNIEKLIDRGIITKHVVKTDAKENETTYWTLNFEFDFEIESDNPLSENETRVIPNPDNGYTESGQKEDTLKDIKDNLKDNKSYNPKISELVNEYMPNQYDEKGLLAINKTFDKLLSKNITIERCEQLIELMSQRYIKSLNGFLHWLLNEETTKPNTLMPEKEEKLKAPTKITRKELVPQWLKDKKEGKEPKKVEKYDAETWEKMKAEMEAKLKAL